ncbi:MAG TPA: BTAD domain-containing putative transcriptional regulator [Gemmatimonadales bacterium]|jgi:DNA-binding SARP family transcriptional activator|nr:BTAD domain-containing putative transcriptional regulator [Gemmatimonadales bacterium]
MLRLRTFGGLSLSRGAENLTGAVTQRRRLAILALLAVARDGGLSRDKLQACLWPESDAERARHVLNQLLYAQRRQPGQEALFVGKKTLRLNPEVITTDVAEFEEALTRGALEEAVALYGGPFLDGFFLKDAPEFERWVDGQRNRLARQAGATLIALAKRAALNEDDPGALAWWRRAADLDPLDSTVALALVQTLARLGDRSGALRHARRHAQELAAQLGVPPDPGWREIIIQLEG